MSGASCTGAANRELGTSLSFVAAVLAAAGLVYAVSGRRRRGLLGGTRRGVLTGSRRRLL